MLHYTDTRIAKFNRRRDVYDWKAENLTDGVKPFAGVQPGLYLGELPGEPFRLPRPQRGSAGLFARIHPGLVPQPRTAGAHCAEDGPLYRIRLPGRAILRAAGHGTDREAAPLLPRVGGRLFCGCHR